MHNRKFGWIKQPDEITINIGKLRKTITKNDLLSSKIDLSKFGDIQIPNEFSIDDILNGYTINQYKTSSCVANAVHYAAVLVQLLSGVAKEDVIYPSVLGMYQWSRSTHGAQLIDSGTYIFTLFEAVAALGVPNQNDWPFNVNKVNIKPSWDVYTGANDHKWLNGYNLVNNSSNLALDLKRRLYLTKKPIIFGTPVDTPFCDLRSWNIWEYNGSFEGSHCMTIVGFDNDSLYILNSWGTDSGVNGRLRIGNSTVNTYFNDVTSVDNFPY